MIFRYPGGKSKVCQNLYWYTAEAIGEYREPFIGGGGMMFGVAHPYSCIANKWINDANPGLIAVYEALRDRPAEFIAACKEISPAQPGEPLTPTGPRGGAGKNARLAAVFDQFKEDDEMDQALRYFFLNRTSYAGRVNYAQESRTAFSNPDGWNIVDTEKLSQAATWLQGARITCGDYSPLLSEPGTNVFVYLDPPYMSDTERSQSSQLYEHTFTMADHLTLRDRVAACPHKVCISYDNHPTIRELYSDFHLIEESWKYSGSSLSEKVDGQELVITNYEPIDYEINPNPGEVSCSREG